MSLIIEIANRRDFQSYTLREMHQLRAKVFGKRLEWDVLILSGMEIDGYDAMDPHYMMMHDLGGQLRGCWRLLPTDGPYMLKDSFPQLLHGAEAPSDPRIWELSRFAIETDRDTAFGFSNIAMHSIAEIIAYGHRNNIEQYVTVTTTAIERMLRKAGIVMRRFGPSLAIGVENAVALYIEIEASHQALAVFRAATLMQAAAQSRDSINLLAGQRKGTLYAAIQ